MPNVIPYLLLILCIVPVLIWLLCHTRQFHTIALYFSFVGMIYIFEFFIIVILDAYEYAPGIFPNRYKDNMVGAVVSNFIAVPIIATLIGTLQLRSRWIVIFACLFGAIEWGFLRLGVYVHHWWTIGYTVVSLLFFFWLTRMWMRQVQAGNAVLRYVTYFTYVFCLTDTLVFAFILFGLRQFASGLYDHNDRDDVFVTVLYAFAKAAVIVNATYWTRKARWISIGLAMALILASQIFLIRFGILHVYISYGLYYSIYVPCCAMVFWLSFRALHALRHPGRLRLGASVRNS
ncbi:hypothetical protein PAESOLCIP111_05060 [Paenibacillus solanacearum]|uniref:Uncharacterized protein n=1 Tax=Paenibacillus solanacearum TaxID=2048548 RepID=A0A916K6T3_9BACL|nr:hypothetical protein [Paenibacillus solanacearum]CAG7645955.1 hypothetical protein PAESOLCIP111_05060 [Paenibacillus solanacearum]